jgi:TRAP-type C4-dicarboxylate transport system substrate-binding protein
MYPALQQKVMEGVELVYNNIPAGRFYEVLKYVSETGHIMLVNFQVVSAKWFNALPADYQRILVEECDKAGIETSKLIMDKLEKEVKQDLIKRGMVVVDKVDLPAFKRAGNKAYEVLKIADVKEKVFAEIGKK